MKKYKNSKKMSFSNRVNNLISDRLSYVLIVIFSIVFSLVFFYKTPFSDFIYQDGDNFIYTNAGYFMTKGLVMYRDFIDNKGPILYFINYVSILYENLNLIYIISLICLIIHNFYVYKIARLRVNELKSFLTVVISCSFLLGVTREHFTGLTNNMVEFYALPFFAYVFYKYLKKDRYNNLEQVILGAVCAVLFYLRANLISISFIISLLIIIKYYKNKKIDYIYKYILYFVIGFLIITLPILLYFYINNSIQYFFTNYLFFNFDYILERPSRTNKNVIFIIKYAVTFIKTNVHFLKNIYIMITFAVSISLIIRYKFKYIKEIIIFIVCYLFATSISLRSYDHYVWVLAPIFAFYVSLILDKKYRELFIVPVIIIALINTHIYSIRARETILYKRTYNQFSASYYECIEEAKKVSKDEDDIFLFVQLNNYMYKDIGIKPTGNYMFQYFVDYLYDYFTNSFNNKNPKIIIKEHTFYNYITEEKWYNFINENLNNKYTSVYKNSNYEIYRLKDEK